MTDIMSQTFRPESAWDFISGAFRLCRANFLTLIAITAVVEAPVALIMAIVNSSDSLLGKIIVLLAYFLHFLSYGALIAAISRFYLGMPVSVTEAYKIGSRRYRSLLGSTLLIGLILSIPILILIIVAPTILRMISSDPIVAKYGIIFFLSFSLLFFLAPWIVYMDAIVLENIGASESLKRSQRLAKGNYWRIIEILLVSFLLLFVIFNIPVTLLREGFNRFVPHNEITPYLNVLISFVINITSLITYPFYIAVTVLLYFDLRRRKGEGIPHVIRQHLSVTPQARKNADT